MRQKVFVYLMRHDWALPHLLVSISHHEAGFEVPKGSLNGGETPEEGAVREVYEETGITGLQFLRGLGVTQWQDEEQYFVLYAAPDGLPETFQHTVHSSDGDNDLVYRYEWLPLSPTLEQQLVQGCSAYVTTLLQAYV